MSDVGRVPKGIEDQDVVAFLTNFGLTNQPVYVEFGDRGYAADFCHVSVKHIVQNERGRRIHGWAIWQFDNFVVAEFHSVWENPDGVLVDITPPKWGASRVLFVADPSLAIVNEGNRQILYSDRTSIKDFPYLFRGEVTESDVWAMPNDHILLTAYAAELGLPDTSMV